MPYLIHGFLRECISHSHNVPPQLLPYFLQVDWHYILKMKNMFFQNKCDSDSTDDNEGLWSKRSERKWTIRKQQKNCNYYHLYWWYCFCCYSCHHQFCHDFPKLLGFGSNINIEKMICFYQVFQDIQHEASPTLWRRWFKKNGNQLADKNWNWRFFMLRVFYRFWSFFTILFCLFHHFFV